MKKKSCQPWNIGKTIQTAAICVLFLHIFFFFQTDNNSIILFLLLGQTTSVVLKNELIPIVKFTSPIFIVLQEYHSYFTSFQKSLLSIVSLSHGFKLLKADCSTLVRLLVSIIISQALIWQTTITPNEEFLFLINMIPWLWQRIAWEGSISPICVSYWLRISVILNVWRVTSAACP